MRPVSHNEGFPVRTASLVWQDIVLEYIKALVNSDIFEKLRSSSFDEHLDWDMGFLKQQNKKFLLVLKSELLATETKIAAFRKINATFYNMESHCVRVLISIV